MSKCQCCMAISITGDGCRYCQPQEYIDRVSEWLQENREEASSLEAERDTLRKQLDEARELLDLAMCKPYGRWDLLDKIDAWLKANTV